MEGRAEGHADIARNLLKTDMTVEQIIDVTGLTRAEIEALRDID